MIVIVFDLEPSMASFADAEPILVIRLSVGMDISWDMLPYPSARRTVVTRGAFLDAQTRFAKGTSIERALQLEDLRIVGQPVPDLTVTPSLAPSRLNVDGFLGLDFFSQFDLVEWQPKTSWMRLTAN